MESNNDGISTTRNTPIPPTLPTLTINSTSDGDNGEGDGEGAEEDETEDDLGKYNEICSIAAVDCYYLLQ